jgi:type IV pilus assembly protein PilV
MIRLNVMTHPLNSKLLQRRSAKGATLIEVLVAIFLLTVGLLAMAALTTSATGYNKLSQLRGTATMLADDYAEQARANLRAFDVSYYGMSSTPTKPSTDLLDKNGSFAAPGGLEAAKLVAQWDKYNWSQNLQNRLPAGDATVVTSTAAVGDSAVRVMEIWIKWKEPGTGFDVTGGSSFAKCPSGTDSSYSCLYFKAAI